MSLIASAAVVIPAAEPARLSDATLAPATVTLHEMCLEAVAHAVERPDVMAKFGIPDQFHGWVRESW